MFQISVCPENAPDEPAYVEIEFESGTPVAVERREAVAGRPDRPSRTRWAGRTASAGSTWSRTAWWA